MAVTLITAPRVLGLASNKIVWVFDSTNKAVSGFRYVVDVYYAGTSTKIIEQKITPDITTGYCTVDLAKILSNLLSSNLNTSNTTYLTASELFTKYDIKVGEEVPTKVSYTSSVTQNGSYVKITATHSFGVGDQVVIEQVDGGAANPGLEGLFTVTAITSTTDFTVNSLWSAVTNATIDGSVTYSDGRKTITRDLYTASNYLAYRGCLTSSSFATYNDSDYTNSTALTGKFLSKGNGVTALSSSLIFLSLYSTATQTTARKIWFVNDAGDTFSKAINTTTNLSIIQIAVGGGNLGTLTNTFGTAPLIKSNTKYYDVYTTNTSDVITSEVFRIYVDQRCNINEIELLFMDKLGSWLSFPFTLRQEISGDVKRNEYKETNVGFRTFYTEQREKYQLRSNWLDQTMADLFNELIASPYVYLVRNGVYTFARITDNSYTTQQQKNKRLIQYTINVEDALDIPTN